VGDDSNIVAVFMQTIQR